MAPEVTVTDTMPVRRRELIALAVAAALSVALAGCGAGPRPEAAESVSPTGEVARDPVRSVPSAGATTAEPSTDPSQVPGTDPAPVPIMDEDGPRYALQIPSLGVRAPVVGIRMNDDLVLAPPRDPDVVGWWSQGVEPGAPTGTAVLVGHTVRSGGGALDDIDRLVPGATVGVAGRDYRVDAVEVMSKDELARRSGELFDQSAPGRVVLITCEDWDGTAFRSNVVVTAVPA